MKPCRPPGAAPGFYLSLRTRACEELLRKPVDPIVQLHANGPQGRHQHIVLTNLEHDIHQLPCIVPSPKRGPRPIGDHRIATQLVRRTKQDAVEARPTVVDISRVAPASDTVVGGAPAPRESLLGGSLRYSSSFGSATGGPRPSSSALDVARPAPGPLHPPASRHVHRRWHRDRQPIAPRAC